MLIIFIVTASTLVSNFDINYFGVIDSRNELVLLLANSNLSRPESGRFLVLEKFAYVSQW